MQIKITKEILLLIFALALAGCATKAEINWHPPVNVAVLPFDNITMDENGPVLARLIFIEHISNMGYNVQDPRHTDEILRNLGITYGGQLGSITPQELVQNLGVDGLFYGTVLKFEYTVGLLNTTKYVRLKAKFIDGWRNLCLWENESGVEETKSRLAFIGEKPENILNDTATDIGRDLINKAIAYSLKDLLGHPLYNQSDQTVSQTLKTLPDCQPGYVTPAQ